MEDKERILKLYLEDVLLFSDKMYQEKVWTRNVGAKRSDLEFRLGDYFEKSAPIFEHHKQFDFTDQQWALLLKLHEKMDHFSDSFYLFWEDKSLNELIALPEWIEIRSLSKEVLKAFDSKSI